MIITLHPCVPTWGHGRTHVGRSPVPPTLDPPEDAEYRNQLPQEPASGVSTSWRDSGPLGTAGRELPGQRRGKAGQRGAAGPGHHRRSLISRRKSCEDHLAEAHRVVAAFSGGGQRAAAAPLICRGSHPRGVKVDAWGGNLRPRLHRLRDSGDPLCPRTGGQPGLGGILGGG